MNPPSFTQLATKLGVHSCNSDADPMMITRTQGNSSVQLDYLATTEPSSPLTSHNLQVATDHLLVCSTIELSINTHIPGHKRKREHVIKADPTDEEIRDLLLDPDWPHQSFIRLAIKHSKTTKRIVKEGYQQRISKLNRTIEDIEQILKELRSQMTLVE